MSVRSKKQAADYDVIVVGGGMTGICAAIACARLGIRTALVHARPVLGGNASSEIRVGACGATANHIKPDLEETGIFQEILLENKRVNPNYNFSVWDAVLYNSVQHEENLTVYMNTDMYDCTVQDGRITAIDCYQGTTEIHWHLTGRIFIDCTGNLTLGFMAGADYTIGREDKAAYTMRTYAAQDMLLDLTPYKETGLKCIFDKFGDSVDTPYLYYDGRMYMIPTNDYQDNAYYTMYFRQDWADRMNLKAPATVEELFDFCSAIAAADLDGNGQKDTIGFTGYGLQALDAIANAYDAGLGNYVIVRDGKVTSSLLQPGMKDALTMIRKFFDADLVDPDILGAKSEIKAHTLSGNFGISVMKWSDVSKAAYLTQAHEINPDLVYNWCGPMASEIEGAESVYGILDFNRNTRDKYVISASVSEEKLEAIFKVLQYLCTDEGSMMVYVGLEGDHWQRGADGSITMTERGKTETLYAYKYQILGREEAAYLALKFPEAADVVSYCLNTPRYIIYNKSVEIPADFYLSDLENYVNMQLIAFVKGERPVSEYDQFIDELYKTYDFQRYLDICAEQLVALGYAAE